MLKERCSHWGCLKTEIFFAKVFLLMFLQSVTRALFDNILVEIGRGQTAGSIKQRSGPYSPDIGYWIFAEILDNM